MAKLNFKQIQELGRQTIKGNPGGIRFGQLHKQIMQLHPELNTNTVNGAIWNLDSVFPKEITKPSRGLFKWRDSMDKGSSPDTPKLEKKLEARTEFKEHEYYDPFCVFLKGELEVLHDAIPLGGSIGAKWMTPDVVGVYKSPAGAIVKFEAEIVSAEIKKQGQNPVEAFGQAAAYRLFSTKAYVVIPANSLDEENSDRLEALCMLYGIGLVLFEPNPKEPKFKTMLRAQRFNPDMFYVNQFAESLKKSQPDKFKTLF